MKQLNLIGFLATVIMLSIGCCKDVPPPCNPSYFVDVTLKEKQGIEHTLMIGNTPFDSWNGDTLNTGRTFDVTDYYTGEPLEFRVRAFIDLGGPNIDGIFYYSDVFRDSVRVPGERRLELVDQTGSGVLWVERVGNQNTITLTNSLNCKSTVKVVYNMDSLTFDLPAKEQYRFKTTDSVFNISFQLLTPCDFYPNELMKVSSSSIQDIDINPTLAVRKEDCGEIKK